MSVPQVLNGRYEIREVLGQDGTGVLHRAHDTAARRDVVVNTLRGAAPHPALERFRKQCEVLAEMRHPNIVEVLDVGEYEDGGISRPFLVMPFVPGVTLEELIRTGSQRLTVDRAVQIICHTAWALHAVHERGWVHGGLTPGSIVVIDEDAVRLLDFGVVDMLRQASSSGVNGALPYMAPELIESGAPTPASDIFSLGAVAYEALVRRKPFENNGEGGMPAATRAVPSPASDVNPAVGQLLSRAVHKAMAKQASSRYASAEEFAETLMKALRNEPIGLFDPSYTKPRIERAQKAFEAGDLQGASDILSELESEGHIDPAMTILRRQIQLAGRTRTVGQLLETARTRFDREDFALALQNVQEILQVHPGNAQALALKASIENRLTTQRLEDCFRLAHEHLENAAFAEAREAIQQVFRIRPGEVRAKQLADEIDRCEAEFAVGQKQTQELYDSALNAWKSGEVTLALTKAERLMALDRKSAGPARRRDSHQQFYDQVRYEHEACKSAYAEARKLLSAGNLAAANAIADEWLARRPGNAVFQALKFDIAGQQSQAVPDGAMSGHPGPTPNAGPPAPQLGASRERQALVDSIAAKARSHEQRGQFAEALAEWEILKTIDDTYPGLALEMERVVGLSDEQASAAARGRWIEKIERAIADRDFGRAAKLAEEAQVEFPGNPELDGLKRQSEDAAQKAAEAEKLIAQGRALCAQQWFDEGIETMRKALAIAPAHAAARAALVDTLLERARVLLDTDWRAAEPLIEEAGKLDPANAVAKSLRAAAADHKRDEIVVRCFTQARQLRAAGNLQAALGEAEACFAQYPLDPRLQQLRDILAAEIAKTRPGDARANDLDIVRHLEGSARAASSDEEVAGMLGRAKQIAAKYPDDSGFQSAVNVIEMRLLELTPGPVPQPSASAADVGAAPPPLAFQGSAPPPETSAPPAFDLPTPVPTPAAFQQPPSPPQPFEPVTPPPLSASVPPPPAAFPQAPVFPPDSFPPQPGESLRGPGPQEPPAFPPPASYPQPGFESGAPAGLPTSAFPAAAVHPSVPPPNAPQPQQPPVQPPRPPQAPKAKGKAPLIWVGAGVGAVLLVLLGVLFALKSRNAPPPGALTIAIRTIPSGAVIRVDGKVRGTSNFDLVIAPGKYQVEAQLEGYQPASAQLSAAPGAGPIELALQPIPNSVRIVTDLPDGKVSLDDQPARDLQDGQAVLDNVPAGAHTVKIASKSGEAVFTLNIASGAPPELAAPPQVKNVVALAVANLGGSAHVYTSLDPAKVELDGAAAGDAVPGGLALRNLAPGTHEIAAGDGKTQIRKTIETGGAPALTAFLQSDQNIGTILVLAGEDGAQVFIDGKPWRRATSRGGQVRIPREPKEYRVRVAKDGFEDTPEQTVQIGKGQEKKVVFRLVPKPTTAKLHFRGATPGAQVFLDGREVGTVGPDGSFQAGSVPPGEHSVELRSGKLRSRAVRRNFSVGQAVELAAADVAVRPAAGTLKLNVTPASAQVTIARAGGGTIPVTGASIEVEEGSYTVTARAAGYSEKSETVQVSGGQTAQVNLALVAQQQKPKVTVGRMEGWEKPWQQDGEWYVRKGGGAVLYKPAGPGTYSFNLMLASGGGVFRGKNLEWIANWVDGRNYILYRLEKDGFRRIVTANGRKTESPKRPHGLDMKQVLATVQVEVMPDSIVNRLKVADKWVVVDSYSAPGANLTGGKFGIQIQGNDELRLSGFGFVPKE